MGERQECHGQQWATYHHVGAPAGRRRLRLGGVGEQQAERVTPFQDGFWVHACGESVQGSGSSCGAVAGAGQRRLVRCSCGCWAAAVAGAGAVRRERARRCADWGGEYEGGAGFALLRYRGKSLPRRGCHQRLFCGQGGEGGTTQADRDKYCARCAVRGTAALDHS